MTKKLIVENGIEELVDFTSEEETKFEADKVKYEEDKTAFLNDIQTKETLKASAKAKLIAGEALTEEEANVMIGG